MPVKRQLVAQEIQQAGFWAVVLWPACKLLQTWATTPVRVHLLPLQYLQAFLSQQELLKTEVFPLLTTQNCVVHLCCH